MEKFCKLDGKTYCSDDKPIRPPIARPGGKTQMADKIIKLMKDHKVYNEPFVGGGAVFLKKPKAQKSYINDKDSDVIAVFRSFKNKVGFEKCDMTPSERRFNKIRDKKKKSDCDVAYLNKLSFGSGMKSFARKKFTKPRKDIGIIYQQKHQEDYKKKLSNTTILNADFKEVMKKADSKQTVHFLDPPYVKGSEIYKHKGVTPKEVCDTAKKMKGQVIITYDDNALVRNSCKGLKMQTTSTRFILSANSNNKKSKELILIKP